MYSFNISINSEHINKPCQIMPRRTQGLYDISTINVNANNNKILIHTSYITHIWSVKSQEYHSTQWLNLKNYLLLAKKLNSHYILVHGPKSSKEYLEFGNGLQWLQTNFNKYCTDGLKIVIEIPAFTKELNQKINNKYKFVDDYLQTIVNAGFDIVLDTAHLYANGLNCREMVALIDKYENNFEWLHLNGNSRPQFTSDEHIFILSKFNKFVSEVDVLLQRIFRLNNCICILESLSNEEDDTSQLSIQYNFTNVLDN